MSVYPASIDDNDPQVIYSDGWVLVTQDGSWTGTMHSTSVTGSWARLRFTGSRVAVVCTIPTGDGALSQASFSLDNGPAVNAAHATTPPVQWQTVFWDSGPLPFASHLLVITNTGDQAYFRLDHIDYDPTNNNAPASASSQAGSLLNCSSCPPAQTTLTTTIVDKPSSPATILSTPSSSSHETTPTTIANLTSSSQTTWSGGSTASTTVVVTASSSGAAPESSTTNGQLSISDNSPNAPRKSNAPTADIIAGVLGGLLVVVLAALALYFLWARRRRRRLAFYLSDRSSSPGFFNTAHINRSAARSTIPVPFNLNQPPSTSETSTSDLVQPARPESHVLPRSSLHQPSQPSGSGWSVGGGVLPPKHIEASGAWNTPMMHSSGAVALGYGAASHFTSEFQEAPPAYSGRVP
ncbi:hypothetical protein CVT26_006477 [Gymnopilus dilepis]|uniref:Transmembrane protein n=1 Tax=Gymnopilus dilepis TaxID=231916 RepID=A0A409W6H9_9AGAR|nr:hypothetical protein CVT26_006477 [Gymnopilus dilepis]